MLDFFTTRRVPPALPAGYDAVPDADLRVPLRQRPPLRGHAEDHRRPGDHLRELRCGRAARVPPRRRAFQGVRLLQHGLRHRQAQARDGRIGQVRRRQAGQEEQGQEGRLGHARVRLLVVGLLPAEPVHGLSALARQPRRKRATSASFVASSTTSPSPPSGSVSPPDGWSTRCLAFPPVNEAAATPSSVGPAMSERTAWGAAHDTHGRRTNVSSEVTLSFMAATSCCWRRARSRSFSLGAHSFLRVRASASAWSPSISVSPLFSRRVKPPLALPPLILETTQPPS